MIGISASAQFKTEYLDKFYSIVDKGEHTYYRTKTMVDDTTMKVEYFNADDKLKEVEYYLGDSMKVPIGEHLRYFENGQLSDQNNYKNGKLEGSSKGYYESGEKFYVAEFRAGDTISSTYWNISGEEVPKYTVDRLPKMEGGVNGLLQYLAENTKYPPTARDAGIQGIVYVRFVIKADGSLGETYILRSVHPTLDEEALRVVKGMPNWEPGLKYGKPADVYFNLPIRFTLRTNKSDRKSRKERRKARRAK